MAFGMTILLGLPALLATVGTPVDLVGELTRLDFDRGDRTGLRAGRIVTTYPDRDLDQELVVAAAMYVSAPVDEVVAALRARTGGADRRVHERHEIGGGDPSEFDGVGFSRRDLDEQESLADAEPGSDFNLDTSEIRLVRSGGYGPVLHRRYAAYRQRGLEGIAPYDRGDGDLSRPAVELASAASSDRRLLKHFPSLRAALTVSPAAVPGPQRVEQAFSWIRQTVEERPHFVLEHRLIQVGEEQAMVVERQFYSGHSYNCAQWVCVICRTTRGTLILCTQRTYTDLVAGIGTSVRHRLGRGALKDEVVGRLTRLRAALGK